MLISNKNNVLDVKVQNSDPDVEIEDPDLDVENIPDVDVQDSDLDVQIEDSDKNNVQKIYGVVKGKGNLKVPVLRWQLKKQDQFEEWP